MPMNYVIVISLVLLIFPRKPSVSVLGTPLCRPDSRSRALGEPGDRGYALAGWHRTRGYRRRDGTPVRGYVARNPRRATGLAISITVAGLAISSSGGSAAESTGRANDGKFSATVSSDDVQANYERAAGRILRSGYHYKYLVLSIDSNCVAHSYGKVQEFFRSNPCKWLARAYVVLEKKGSEGEMLVDFIWVEMPTSAQAEECQHLMGTPGSGSVTELAVEDGSPYKDTYLPIDYYTTGIVGTAVWNVQLQPFAPVPFQVITKVLNDGVPSF
jgi:hypothetical protein